MVSSNISKKENDKLKCFVITPVGEQNSEIRNEANGIIEAVIKPVLEAKYTVNAAHLSISSVIITKEIIQDIFEADLIIANLTDSNPNVMYELSFAHALRKPVVHLIREGQKPPFDISSQRYIAYTNNMLGTVHLKEQLEKFVNDVTDNKKKISNPITDSIDMIEIKPETREMVIVDALNDISRRLTGIERERGNRIRLSSRVDKSDGISSTSEFDVVNNFIIEQFINYRINSLERFDKYKSLIVSKVASKFGYAIELSEKAVVWNFENRSKDNNLEYAQVDI